MMSARAVLDTNVVVSALVFTDGRMAWLREAWQSGAVRPLVSRPVVAELIRVLEYPKYRLEPDEREILLGDYLPACEVVRVSGRSRAIPQCRDPNDRMFLELALAGKAQWLVSGDADILDLARTFPVPIVTPEHFRAALSTASEPRASGRYVPAAVVSRKPQRRPSAVRAK
ncbi:MAG: putative toxin-antitoxin system toxin component, PIN family [Usitatibacter sp.]